MNRNIGNTGRVIYIKNGDIPVYNTYTIYIDLHDINIPYVRKMERMRRE